MKSHSLLMTVNHILRNKIHIRQGVLGRLSKGDIKILILGRLRELLNIFSKHNAMKAERNSKRNFGKFTEEWKESRLFLTNQWVEGWIKIDAAPQRDCLALCT